MDWTSVTMILIYCALSVAVTLGFGAIVHYGNPDNDG